jgi:hypothetical protein
MIAFHGDTELQRVTLEEAQWHYDQDRLLAGTYGDEE